MRPLRILLVDDDGFVRRSVHRTLRHAGHQVLEAANGAEALVALDADLPPDLILLDLRMPVMNGETFLRHKATTPHARIPVVVLSGTAGGPIPGAFAVLEKPVNSPVLLLVCDQATSLDDPALPPARRLL